MPPCCSSIIGQDGQHVAELVHERVDRATTSLGGD
jgi:hypothetical protein